MQIINPANEEIIRDIQDDNRESIEKKFRMLKDAQQNWQKTRLAQRVEMIKTFSHLLGQQADHLAQILTSEVGKPLQQSRNELKGAMNRIDWLANHASTRLNSS